MASLNKITLIGHAGGDPEVREFEGRKVANFSLATTEKYRDRSGNLKERTEWFRVSFWGNTAEVVEKYVKKGSQVYVEGRLSTQEYTDRNGEKRVSLEVSGQTLTLLGSASGGGNAPGTGYGNASQNTGTSYAKESDVSSVNSGEPEEDLPF